MGSSTAPRTKREWLVYRAGVLEGVERANANARATAEAFRTHVLCGGVQLSTPSAALAETEVKFTPQLKTKRRTA